MRVGKPKSPGACLSGVNVEDEGIQPEQVKRCARGGQGREQEFTLPPQAPHDRRHRGKPDPSRDSRRHGFPLPGHWRSEPAAEKRARALNAHRRNSRQVKLHVTSACLADVRDPGNRSLPELKLRAARETENLALFQSIGEVARNDGAKRDRGHGPGAPWTSKVRTSWWRSEKSARDCRASALSSAAPLALAFTAPPEMFLNSTSG